MKRLFVLTVMISILFLFSLVLIPFARADWIMFHADTTYSGAGTGNPVLTPALLWKYATSSEVHSSPAIVNGVVYVGSYDQNVYALNANTGAKLWNYVTSGRFIRLPLLSAEQYT